MTPRKQPTPPPTPQEVDAAFERIKDALREIVVREQEKRKDAKIQRTQGR